MSHVNPPAQVSKHTAYTPLTYSMRAISSEISTKVGTNWNNSCTFQWIFQQPMMIQWCFNFLNTLHTANGILGSITIVLQWKKMFYKFWRLLSTPASYRLTFHSVYTDDIFHLQSIFYTNFIVKMENKWRIIAALCLRPVNFLFSLAITTFK